MQYRTLLDHADHPCHSDHHDQKEYIELNYSSFQNTNVEIYFNDISDI